MEKKKKAQIVFPGEIVGVEEEALPGKGTTVDEHKLRVTLLGKDIGKRHYRYSLSELHNDPNEIKKDKILIGIIQYVRRKRAEVLIKSHDGKKIQPQLAYLTISHIRKAYVKNIDENIAQGDIIRCKLLPRRSGKYVNVQTSDNGLGAIISYCTQCRGILTINEKKKDMLDCSICGTQEKRRIAKEHYNMPMKIVQA